MVAKTQIDVVPENIPAIPAVKAWLDALNSRVRRADEARSEGTYSFEAAVNIRRQFLDYCAFLCSGNKEGNGPASKALTQALLHDGKENLAVYLEEKSAALQAKTLATLAANLRQGYVFLQASGFTNFDPAEVKTPGQAFKTLPIFEEMLAERYSTEQIRVSRRHELARFLVFTLGRVKRPQDFSWREEERAAEMLKKGEALPVKPPTLTSLILNKADQYVPPYVATLDESACAKHFSSTLRHFYIWVRDKRRVEVDPLALLPSTRHIAGARKRRAMPGKPTKSPVGRRSAAKKPEPMPEWAGILPAKLVERDRGIEYRGLDALLLARDAAVTELILGAMRMSLTQVCLLTRHGFKPESGTVEVPFADGSVRQSKLDSAAQKAVQKYITLLSSSPVCGVWQKSDVLFAARDGKELVIDNATEGESAELGFLLCRNRAFTDLMRECQLSFRDVCALRRADVSGDTVRCAGKSPGRRKISGTVLKGLHNWFQAVRVSPFTAFWNQLEQQHALFFATDRDNLTA